MQSSLKNELKNQLVEFVGQAGIDVDTPPDNLLPVVMEVQGWNELPPPSRLLINNLIGMCLSRVVACFGDE